MTLKIKNNHDTWQSYESFVLKIKIKVEFWTSTLGGPLLYLKFLKPFSNYVLVYIRKSFETVDMMQN